MWHAGAGGLNPPVMGPILRVLIDQLIRPAQTEEAVEVQLAALQKLWVWMRRSSEVDLPCDFEVVAVQYRGVSTALSTAMAEEHLEHPAYPERLEHRYCNRRSGRQRHPHSKTQPLPPTSV
jgi:hypothetical protein